MPLWELLDNFLDVIVCEYVKKGRVGRINDDFHMEQAILLGLESCWSLLFTIRRSRPPLRIRGANMICIKHSDLQCFDISVAYESELFENLMFDLLLQTCVIGGPVVIKRSLLVDVEFDCCRRWSFALNSCWYIIKVWKCNFYGFVWILRNLCFCRDFGLLACWGNFRYI